jgi:alpha-amylase/alpha-mannosidase (GH57 family)
MPRCAKYALLILLLAAPALAGDLYLNLIWHQHQPLYVNPQTDELRGPWVRTHATKDYYDMAAMHRDFPEVHATINLTSSLLYQLQTYYVARIFPYLYQSPDGSWAVKADDFLAKWQGKTDPWIDLALRPSASLDSTDRAHLLTDPWNAFGISGVQIAHFPEYAAMRDKSPASFTTDDLTQLKAWFYLAHFDPDFLRGTSQLDVNFTDLLAERDGKFYLRHPLTETDANRLVADAVRVMSAIIPEHSALMYNPQTGRGQLEIITTPFYHPILPLLINTDIAHVCQPRDSLPLCFAYPQDARAQVDKSVAYYEQNFTAIPHGMWPAEGSISEAAADVFAESGIEWIAGDMQVLAKSTPPNLPLASPYRLQTAHGKNIALVFRDTFISDAIGFTYQNMDPDSAATDFMQRVVAYKPSANQSDRLLTVILDGENAWEWYTRDQDGKKFLHALYTKLTDARAAHSVTCVTPTEYFVGNPQRKVPAHPIDKLPRIAKLWPGSWINANFDTWIGEKEENDAWNYLLRARQDLETSKLSQPDPKAPAPTDPKALSIWRAWESMYAAEGSDWFWWYGADQTSGSGDLPFEQAFFSHLQAVYTNMKDAGVNTTVPKLEPILTSERVRQQLSGGVMAKGKATTARVKFVCDASKQSVKSSVFIVGNLPDLGAWQPNAIVMFDDGTHGDEVAHDGLWSLEIEIPVGSEVQYKYTNSGDKGVWGQSEEFAFHNRTLTVDVKAGSLLVRKDVFGQQ